MKGTKELTISIDRQARQWAVFEDSCCVKEFERFSDEAKALAEARAWVAERSSVEPQIVYPRITSIRMRS